MKQQYISLKLQNIFLNTLRPSLHQPKPSFLGLILMVVYLFMFDVSNAQVAGYTFNQAAGTHTAITGGTNASSNNWDDDITIITIPFTFTFNSIGYTSCNISTNGFITFGATAPATTNYLPISSTAGYAGAISVLARDLGHNGTRVQHVTTGTTPNRVLTVQWIDARRFDGGTKVNNDFDFQIKLYETSNIVQVVYGPCATTYTTDLAVQVGLRGAANTDFNNRTTTNNWPASTAGGTNAATCNTGNGAGELPTGGLTYTWTPPALVPTITSLTTSNGCTGDSLIINGTNLSSATAVTIGGTAATITGNTATTVTVTVGSGTTGTVAVTTSGGTATSSGTYTVSTIPANPANPTSNSPQCNPTGVTITQTGAAPVGQTWYWQTTATGTSTTSNAATAQVVSTSGTYYIRSFNGTCWSPSSGSVVVTVNNPIATLATIPNPTTAATGVCYAGSGAVTTTSWTAAAGATSYDVYFGTNPVPVFTVNQVGTTYTTGTLLASTTYYWKIVPKSACGDTSGTPIVWSFTTASVPCYCPPVHTGAGCLFTQISNVTFNTLNNPSGCGNITSNSYNNYAATGIPTTTVTRGTTYPLSVTYTGANPTIGSVWIDYNQNAIFEASEWQQVSTTGFSGNINILIPATALTGDTRMRIRTKNSGTNGSGDSCTSFTSGETEDYKITIVACSTPVQPTVLSLTAAGGTISGSFTRSNPVAENYLVVYNTTGTVPTPANGTTYTVAGAITGGTVASINANNYFTVNGLTSGIPYYFYVFAYNSICSGGTLYNLVAPLTGTTTITNPYCLPIYTEGPAAADAIINVTLGTLNNSSSIPATLPAYTFYNAVTIPDLQRGLTASLKVTYSNDPTQFTGVWIDYNQNTIFEAGEGVVTANAGSNGTITIALPVPIGALLGNTRMRIRGGDDAAMLTSQACGLTNSTYGETEDYIVNIINAVTCVAPTTQPTVLTLSPSGTSFTGTFTYASPAADGYLVVRSTSATAPTPVNGTLPAIGASLGGTNVVVDNDTNNSFTATGLTVSTLYYVYVFAYNNYCTGGPTYNLVTPLTGSTTTLAVGYCVPSVTTGFENSVFFSNISFVGTLNDTSNNSTFSSTPLGYQDFTALPNKAIQAQGEGINITTQIGSGRGYTKAWIDWNKDGVFADPGERVYNTAGISTAATVFGFVIPAAQAVGDYRIRIRVSQDDAVAPFDPNAINNFNPCQNIIYFGETEDYLFTVIPSCSANVTSVTNGEVCGSGTVTLGAASTIGGVTGFNWYTTPIGGTAVGSGASFTTPVLATTTNYYARAFSATCEQKVGTLVVAKVSPIPTLNFTPTAPIVCAEEVVFSVTANGDKQELTPINETFNSGLGSFTTVNYISNGATQDAITIWQNRPSTPFVPAQQFWFPAISSGFGGNTFVMTTSDIGQNAGVNYLTHNAIISPAVNTNTYLDLKLTFDMYYSRYFPNGVSPATEFVTVDVSRDGGVTWPYEITRYTSDVGFGSSFSRLTLDLSAHINQPNLKIRFRYNSGWCQGMALDNVKLSGFVPLVTNFTWTGGVGINAYEDAGCTIPFTVSSPAATTIYLKPILSQLEVSNYTFTVNAVLNNGCSAGQTVSVSNKSKVWKGASSTNWNNGLNWAPTGVPDATNCVIIPANTIISGSNYDAFAKNVLVKGTGNLELQSSNNLIVEDFVNINSSGVFNMKDSSNLVQLNPVANVVGGTFNMERISKPMYLFDYTYWSSPLTITTPSKLFTLGNLSSTSPLRYTWIPSVANVSGNWSSATTAVVMNPGGGYIVRAPSTYNSNPAIKANYTANFIGVPNNGDVNTPISHGTMGLVATNDKWNLIGNPYPSAISAEEFLTNTTNTNLIDGTVHFWTHNTPPSTAIVDPFYGDFAINYTATDYSSWNFTGGVATTSGAAPAPNGNIPAGQAFFVRSLGIQPTGTNAVFTNSMRLGATTAYNNSQFYRQNNNPRPASETIEKHRIWLNFTNNSGAFSQVLVGYVQGTTTGYDRGYDGTRFSGNNLSFYSIIPDNSLAIQGRPLPFVDTDIVPLGYNSQLAGNFSIRIDRIDGLFTTQDIFLEDKLLNVVHNLKLTPYTFSTTTGIFNNRFVLRYTDAVLATPDFDYSNSVNVFANNYINVKSTIENIKEILVYDLLGKTLFDSKNIDKKEMILTDFKATQNVLIVKVILDNDAEITKKVIF